MAKPTLKVEGKKEVQRAFDKVASDMEDQTRTNQEVATMLLPDVREATRKRTGALAQSWEAGADAERALFSNPLQYAVPQEYGSKRGVEPTHAVESAFSAKADEVENVYGNAVQRSGDRAGLKTR
jgi:hypothetical protein